ncbi:MAG TPA: type II toxin-antitoxin system VapC family toxin [Urbifossiella sp.]|jgi:tRNA(fMet)-specific endonuclease VapC|nr:type II toxin-antitoxin system VapC family toxin [Urbifossiella sp.]
MIALDTDVLTLVLHGDPALTARLAAVPAADQTVPVVVFCEVLRGRLSAIRQAEAGKGKVSLAAAYDLLRRSVTDSRAYTLLSFTPAAEQLVTGWKRLKLRVGMQDQRIAATCIVHGATLITRNARDHAQLPGLTLDIWT